MEKNFLRMLGILVIIAGLITSGGCVAAIPLMMAAHAGLGAHAVTKAVQMSTDGDVTMAIGENEVQKPQGEKEPTRLALADISRLALWPDEGMVLVAEELERAKVFNTIITPSKTDRALAELGFSAKISNLTYSERLQSFQAVCEKTGAEALVVFEDLGGKTNMRALSFSRSSREFKGKITIFELKSRSVIFSSIAEMEVEFGGSSHNPREVMERGAKLLAQKIVELKRGPLTSSLSPPQE